MKEKQFMEGGAISTFGEDFDYRGNKILSPENNYFILGTSINSLIDDNTLQVPNYLKIDVDGIEHLILQGANKYLKHKNLKGISIELNKNFKEQFDKSFKILQDNGFTQIFKKNSTSYVEKLNETKIIILKK